ncbi:MAG: hypothetical protein ACOCVS_03215 [Planctomycetota bacterium]
MDPAALVVRHRRGLLSDSELLVNLLQQGEAIDCDQIEALLSEALFERLLAQAAAARTGGYHARIRGRCIQRGESVTDEIEAAINHAYRRLNERFDPDGSAQ